MDSWIWSVMSGSGPRRKAHITIQTKKSPKSGRPTDPPSFGEAAHSQKRLIRILLRLRTGNGTIRIHNISIRGSVSAWSVMHYKKKGIWNGLQGAIRESIIEAIRLRLLDRFLRRCIIGQVFVLHSMGGTEMLASSSLSWRPRDDLQRLSLLGRTRTGRTLLDK